MRTSSLPLPTALSFGLYRRETSTKRRASMLAATQMAGELVCFVDVDTAVVGL